jgi:predicted deacylase
MILIHALNPYGFAWLRRVNEDNVDLNRNFRNFSEPLASSAAYEAIHDALVPLDWEGPARLEADAAIQEHIQTRGLAAFQAT